MMRKMPCLCLVASALIIAWMSPGVGNRYRGIRTGPNYWLQVRVCRRCMRTHVLSSVWHNLWQCHLYLRRTCVWVVSWVVCARVVCPWEPWVQILWTSHSLADQPDSFVVSIKGSTPCCLLPWSSGGGGVDINMSDLLSYTPASHNKFYYGHFGHRHPSPPLFSLLCLSPFPSGIQAGRNRAAFKPPD